MRRWVVTILLIFPLVSAVAEINLPRLRPSPYFGSLTGLKHAAAGDIGEHNYEAVFGEKNPLVYTAAAGYIDIGHLRESADRARYLFEVCQDNIRHGRGEFSYSVIEPAVYTVRLRYPVDWDQWPAERQQAVARDVAIEMGQYLAHLSTIWHEIITWYGYASTGLLSEHASSFSWEDGYSDLLGTILAARVLRDDAAPYNEAMTAAIAVELERLSPLPVATAQRATRAIDGKWFVGRYPLLSMKKRNFDVGFDDGAISPFRVPGFTFGTEAIPCEVPPREAMAEHGFDLDLELTPHANEGPQVLAIIHPDGDGRTLRPAEHFPTIVDHLRQLAIEKTGPRVDTPTLD